MKKGMRVLIGYSIVSCIGTSYTAEVIIPWSVVHKKIYTDVERAVHDDQKNLIYTKKHVPPFTQLIVSWNVYRPINGQFDFFIRSHAQGAAPDRWDQWLKVASWGDGIQKSYFSRGGDAVFNYVRLEMREGLLADGFEIKVEALQGASLKDVKAFFISTSNYKEFKPERPYSASKDLESLFITGVPEKSQKMVDHPRLGALCSPTSLSMILEALLGDYIDPLETARGVYDEGLDVFGNWTFNMAYAFEKASGNYFFYTARLSSFAHLYHFLEQDIPVGVSIRGKIKGGRKLYPHGHLLVVVGFDKKNQKVICYDPAFDALNQVKVLYDIAEFIPAWERSYRLAYITKISEV